MDPLAWRLVRGAGWGETQKREEEEEERERASGGEGLYLFFACGPGFVHLFFEGLFLECQTHAQVLNYSRGVDLRNDK